MASAETNPSNPPPNHGSLRPTAEPFVIHINPSTPPLTDQVQTIHPAIEPFLNLQPSSIPPPNNHHGSNIQPTVEPISIPPPNPSSIAQENKGLNNLQPCQTHCMSMGDPSAVVPQQNHGLLSSMLEQLLSQFMRQQPPPPPADYPSTPPPPPSMSSFNFKIEPIVLHIDSSVPFQETHDQSNSQLDKTQYQLPIVQPNQSLHQAPNYIKHQKILKNAESLANLLPTGTVLAFQALAPTLSNDGRCHLTNKVLLACIIGVCTIICFLSSFTDSVNYDNKVYYGIATCKGFLVFNYENRVDEEKNVAEKLKNLNIRTIDFVHAFGSVAVFLIFAFSSSEVLGCFFPRESKETRYAMVIYLPLVACILFSSLFTVFPTKRRGIGYTDLVGGR
ncbi:hypothetical protein FNV43_RR04840 [Rhamnella rubrinervis]|uniref:Uncharacterized protein n=1 Tax=Rhamnella rubrinervis TaxID=2594499 RepID=A0A8K0HMR6_9ROSA|nr:hypothetical protein FNV43_RR04840 [Rhamnella rubrinervis]